MGKICWLYWATSLLPHCWSEVLSSKDKYYFFQPVTCVITHLSVLNSCRSGVTFTELIYLWRVLCFELLAKPVVSRRAFKSNPEISGKLWRGEGNRSVAKCKFLRTHFSLSLVVPLCAALKLESNISAVSENFFSVIVFTRSKYNASSRLCLDASNRFNLTHDGFARRHMDQKRISTVDIWPADNLMQFMWLHFVDLTVQNCQKI